MPTKTEGRESSEKALQRKIGQTRDSLRTTVEAIQDKAEQQYETVKQTVSNVLDYRDEFQKEPVVEPGRIIRGIRSRLHCRLLSQARQDQQTFAICQIHRERRR